MNVLDLKDKKILLLGGSRAFSEDEFFHQLKLLNIKVTREYDKDLALIVEGKMVNPTQQDLLESLYKSLECIPIDIFEDALAKNIDEKNLLMGLKLSKNKERLLSFIKNRSISDELFLKLLGMYDFGEDGFFENDNNRDVSSAIIVRFYKDIDKNHNTQYASTGFIHLLAQSDNVMLLETIASLKPILKDKRLLKLLATHPKSSSTLLETLFDYFDSDALKSLALRDNLTQKIEQKLLSLDDILETLSTNPHLSEEAFLVVLNREFIKNLAQYIELNDERFKILKDESLIAKNPTLTQKMQLELLNLNKPQIDINLAKNSSITTFSLETLLERANKEVLYELYWYQNLDEKSFIEAFKDKSFHLPLANNPHTPSYILENLSHSSDIEILKSVAKNKNTPVDRLYQLYIDSKLAPYVRQNVAFASHLQTQNIGWL